MAKIGTLTLRGKPPQAVIDGRRAIRMGKVDAMPEDWRALVHEYGFTIVEALRDCGVAKARQGRHVIETVLNEMSAFRGGFSSQGERSRADNHLVLVPREPTQGMIEASMATVSTYDVKITKREKHRLRLKAAIEQAIGARLSS